MGSNPACRAAAAILRRASLSALALMAAVAHANVAQGPMVQAVTNRQAGVWVRTTIDEAVRIRYIGPDHIDRSTPPITTSLLASDGTASFLLTGLASDSRYDYQVGTTDPDTGVETLSGTYTFETVGDTVDAFDIAVVSDFKLGMASSAALQNALSRRPGLLAVIGDLDHRDPASDQGGVPYPPGDAPIVLADMRSMHRDSRDPATPLGGDFFSGLIGAPGTGRSQIPWVYAWDDHDFCANNTGRECAFKSQALQAYDEYYIFAPDNAFSAGCAGDFQSLTYGGLVQVFFLDARSQRNEAKPEGKRAMLGPCQHDWLVNGLHKSKAIWKIVMSPTPLNATSKTWDAWSHFPTERADFLAAIADVHNVVVVSGDIHSGGAIDEGEHSGLPEISTPHANMPGTWVNTFCRNQASTRTLLSRPGSWTFGSAIDPIVDVEPMNCLGNTFADNYNVDRIVAPVYPLDGKNNAGYAWISATPALLTVTVRDAGGHVKQGVQADGSAAPLKLSLLPQ